MFNAAALISILMAMAFIFVILIGVIFSLFFFIYDKITNDHDRAATLLRIIKEKINRGEDPALATEYWHWQPVDYVSQLVQISNSSQPFLFYPRPIVIQFNDLNNRLLVGKILIAEIQYSALMANELIEYLNDGGYLKNINHITELTRLKIEFYRKAQFHSRRLENSSIASAVDMTIYQTLISDYQFSIETLILIKRTTGIENKIFRRSKKPLLIIKNRSGILIPYHPDLKILLSKPKLPKI